MTAREYAARRGIGYRQALREIAMLPGARKVRDPQGRAVWDIPEDALDAPEAPPSPLGSPSADTPAGGGDLQTDTPAGGGDPGPGPDTDPGGSGGWDPWLSADLGGGDDSSGDTDTAPPPGPDTEGVAAIIRAGLDALGVDTSGPRGAIADLWSDTAAALAVEHGRGTTKELRYAILAGGGLILFAPTVLRWLRPPHRDSGVRGVRQDQPAPTAGPPDTDGTAWRMS